MSGSGQAPERAMRALPLVGLGLLMAVAAVKWAAGLDPQSLWLDDTWVALAATRMSFGELLTLQVPTPMGFIGALGALSALFQDPEWPLQILPFAASLAVIPLVYAVGVRVASCRLSALVGAALAASNPLLGEYAIRVKQYGTDLLVALGLLWLAVRVMERWSRKDALWLLGACLAAPLLSFASVLVVVSVANALALHTLAGPNPQATPRREARQLALVANAACLVYGLTYLLPAANSDLQWYWRDHFLDPTSLQAIQHFFATRVWDFVQQPFPARAGFMALALPVGAYALWRRGPHAAVATSAALLFAGLLTCAALKLIPLGGGRTDLFSFGFFWVLSAAAIAKLPLVGRALALALFAISTLTAPTARYPLSHDRSAVAIAQQWLTAGDGLLLSRQAAWPAAYYGPWPFHFVPGAWGHNFDVAFERPATGVAPLDPAALDELIASGPRRWLYLVAEGEQRNVFQAVSSMESSGWEVGRVEPLGRGALVLELERN